MKDNHLRKLVPLINHIKNRCLEFYQPLKQLSVDEHMVKSKARSHLIQYMQNKPTKWGFKLWVTLVTHWTLMSTRERRKKVQESMAWLIMFMQLVGPFCFQGYHLCADNFYTSAKLFEDLYIPLWHICDRNF